MKWTSKNISSSPKLTYIIVATTIVSFCSIIYELLFAQALTVIFGGTVTRYSVTIGLFLFSLGIGSYLYSYLPKNRKKNFFIIEIILSITGPLGLFYIFLLNGSELTGLLPHWFILTISHLPIIVVGILSGLELPHLSSFFKTKNTSTFSEVLGFDYIGGLLGTLTYALLLYPNLGLITTVIVIGLLNSLVALGFGFLYFFKKKIFLAIGIITVIIMTLGLSFSDTIEDKITTYTFEKQIENKYERLGTQIDANITHHFNTKYQQVILYEYNLIEHGDITTTCLALDLQNQVCNLTKYYHYGLIDVPMSFLDNKKEKEVLLLGGGDWIPQKELIKFPNVQIDHVDIDNEFYEFTKNFSFTQQFHENSYKSPKVNTINKDAYHFSRTTNKKYDLIVVDLPGIEHDKMLPLYSKEFYYNLNNLLKEEGLLVTWLYPEEDTNGLFEKSNKVIKSTFESAGFDYYFPYNSYKKIPGYETITMDKLILLSNEKRKTPHFNETQYLKNHKQTYKNINWKIMNKTIKPNSLLNPNYDIIAYH